MNNPKILDNSAPRFQNKGDGRLSQNVVFKHYLKNLKFATY